MEHRRIPYFKDGPALILWLAFRRPQRTGQRTPSGVLFAVYDSQSGRAEYIPPEYTDVPEMTLDEINEEIADVRAQRKAAGK